MGTKEHPSEALVGPCRRPRVRAGSSPVGTHCSCREGFVTWGSPAHTHPCCAAPQTLQRTPSTLCIPVTLRTACGSPVDATCTHTRHAARGAGGESSGLHLGPLPARGTVEANAVKPKKLLRRLQGRLACVSSRQLKWKPAPEVLCLAPPGQVPGFPYGLPGGGTGAVIRTGLPAPALACKSTNADVPDVHGPCPRSAPSS